MINTFTMARPAMSNLIVTLKVTARHKENEKRGNC